VKKDVVLVKLDQFTPSKSAWSVIAPSLKPHKKPKYQLKLVPAMKKLLQGMLQNYYGYRLTMDQVIKCLQQLRSKNNVNDILAFIETEVNKAAAGK